MSKEQWTAVDEYVTNLLVRPDSALTETLQASDAAGLRPINVSPCHGKFLHILARAIGAKRILEIGTLGGYSGIWLARALPPDGRLITLEIDPKHAEIARANFERAGVAKRVELRLGKAIESLPKLHSEHAGPFDLVFIDADKQSNADYFNWAIRLSRPGSMIVVDNVIRNGAVLDPASNDENVQGVRRLNEVMSNEPRVTVTELQTVGVKGYDGMAVAIVNS